MGMVVIPVKGRFSVSSDKVGTKRNAWNTNSGPILSIMFSPDGAVLASGHSDGSVHLWDAQTGHELIVLQGHAGNVSSLDFSRDGKLLASAGPDGTATIWGAYLQSQSDTTIEAHSRGR